MASLGPSAQGGLSSCSCLARETPRGPLWLSPGHVHSPQGRLRAADPTTLSSFVTMRTFHPHSVGLWVCSPRDHKVSVNKKRPGRNGAAWRVSGGLIAFLLLTSCLSQMCLSSFEVCLKIGMKTTASTSGDPPGTAPQTVSLQPVSPHIWPGPGRVGHQAEDRRAAMAPTSCQPPPVAPTTLPAPPIRSLSPQSAGHSSTISRPRPVHLSLPIPSETSPLLSSPPSQLLSNLEKPSSSFTSSRKPSFLPSPASGPSSALSSVWVFTHCQAAVLCTLRATSACLPVLFIRKDFSV